MNPTDVLQWTILAVAILFLLIDKKTRGWLSTYVRVMISRGKLVFVTVRAINDEYYKPGKFVMEKELRIKGQNGKNQLYHVEDKKMLHHAFGGLLAMDVDETDGSIVIPYEYYANKENKKYIDEKGKEVNTGLKTELRKSSFNPEAHDDLMETCLNKPEIKNLKKMAKDSLFLILIVCGVAATAYLAYQVMQRQDMLYEMFTQVKECACTGAQAVIR